MEWLAKPLGGNSAMGVKKFGWRQPSLLPSAEYARACEQRGKICERPGQEYPVGARPKVTYNHPADPADSVLEPVTEGADP